MTLVGGLSELKKKDEHIQNIVNAMKLKIEEKIGKEVVEFECVSYKTQVVSGTNYFIRLTFGNKEYLDIKVFRDLPHTKNPDELIDIKLNRKEDDEIVYF